MKGVIASISPALSVIDVTHAIAPQCLTEASFLLGSVDRPFPPGTTFVVVVDPGVGTARRIVLFEAQGRRYLAPDNGVLSRILERDDPLVLARHVSNRRWCLKDVSATFHGRDIFA